MLSVVKPIPAGAGRHFMETADLMTKADELLRQARYRIETLCDQSPLRRHAIGVPELDRRLVTLGREMLRPLWDEQPAAANAAGADQPRGPDVYVATHLQSVGGHTRVLGDFLRALDAPPEGSHPASHLFLTDFYDFPGGAAPEEIPRGLGFAPDRARVLSGQSPAQKLRHLLRHLMELRPARLFLFHHPGDAVAVAAAQQLLAHRIFLVHHADGLPSLGPHVPGVTSIELHPFGAAMSRVLKIPNEMLPLMSPDPGPRPHGFAPENGLVTATAGREEKYQPTDGGQAPEYARTVAAILKTTGGRHMHIGPVREKTLESWRSTLRAEGAPAERFQHIPRVPSLPQALWEQRCDVYLSSFPVDGARTNVEIAASGTPILIWTRDLRAWERQDPFRPEGAMVWANLADLGEHLRACASPEVLEEKARVIRAFYERVHHPEIFTKTLQNIVNGGRGMEDPFQEQRCQVRLAALLRSLALPGAEGTAQGDPHQPAQVDQREMAFLRKSLDEQARKLVFLEEKRRNLTTKCKDLQRRLKALEQKHAALTKGRGWRARLRRWLLRG
jgi:hypothetical protein